MLISAFEIDAPAHAEGERHVRAEAQLDRADKRLADGFHRLWVRHPLIRREGRGPIERGRFTSRRRDAVHGRRREFKHASKKRVADLVERLVPVDEIAVQVLVVDVERRAVECRQEFDFGAEIDPARVPVKVERFFPEAVATQEQRTVGLVQDGESPHPLAPIETGRAKVDQRSQQNLGIAFRAEGVAALFEQLPQFDVVVKFAVVDHDVRPDAERLVGPLVEIDDRESRMQEQGLASRPSRKPVRCGRVGAAAPHEAETLFHAIGSGRIGAEITRNSAHRAVTPRRPAKSRHPLACPASPACR